MALEARWHRRHDGIEGTQALETQRYWRVVAGQSSSGRATELKSNTGSPAVDERRNWKAKEQVIRAVQQ